jgi:segregation and condensation protein A
MGYEVVTEVFSGPFDLLFRLITAEEVDVHEIELARIVDAYLAEMERMEALNLELATEFLLIAATLVELKCRRLLPGPDELELDEDLRLFEERDLLLSRLVECRTFSQAGHRLGLLAATAALSVPRNAEPDERLADVRPDLLAGVTPEKLYRAALRAFSEKPVPRVDVEHVLVDEVTVAEVVGSLATTLRSRGRRTFIELTRGFDRTRVIVSFLAVLELFKQGLVELEQARSFGELLISWVGGDTDPDYHELSAVGTRRTEGAQ